MCRSDGWYKRREEAEERYTATCTGSEDKHKMKVFAFALLLLVAVTYGEALQCNNCVREAPDSGNCVETVEACPTEMDACAKITYPAPHENTFHKSCFKMAECLKLAFTQGLKVSCCNWDGCNQ